MFDFYFFKGEELANRLLTKPGLQIPKELKKLLYQEEWESLRETLRDGIREVGSQLAKLNAREDEYKKLALKLSDLREQERRSERDLASARDQVAKLERARIALDKEVEDLVSRARPERKTQLSARRQEKVRLDARRKEIEKRRREILGTESAMMLSTKQNAAVLSVLSELKRRRSLPPDISEPILLQILEDKRCICGRECEIGTPERRAIEMLREQSLTEQLSSDLWHLHSMSEPSNRQGSLALTRAAVRSLQDLTTEEADLARSQRQIEDVVAELEKGVDDGAEDALLEEETGKGTDSSAPPTSERSIPNLEMDARRYASSITTVEVDLRRAEGGRKVSRGLERQRQKLQELSEIVGKCQTKMAAAIHSALSSSTRRLYDSIVTDGSTALVDGVTLLPSIERSGVEGLASGGGQEQTLLLSYLIGLAELRRGINVELRDRFSVSEFRQQAFFMDSVFGQMQPEYRRAIARFLPEQMTQLVLLLAGQQWDGEVRRGLEGKVRNIYGLELNSPTKVSVAETDFVFETGGKTHKLFKRLPDGAEAFSKIVRLGKRAMATIRMPSNGDLFFHFVKGAPEERSDLSYFPTMRTFWPLLRLSGKHSPRSRSRVTSERRNPVRLIWPVFRNQGLYETLLALAIANTGDESICTNDERLCFLVEALARAGFREMAHRYEACGHDQYWLSEWEKLVLELCAPPSE